MFILRCSGWERTAGPGCNVELMQLAVFDLIGRYSNGGVTGLGLNIFSVIAIIIIIPV